MSNITYAEVRELERYREECIQLGKEYQRNNISYNKEIYNISELLFIEFGRFCETNDLNSDFFENYELFLEKGNIEWEVEYKSEVVGL